MKIKLDENFPTRLVGVLGRLGHDVDTVPAEGFAGKSDAEVWSAACDTGRFFVTQDLDFSDVRRFTPGTHPGLLLVRLREPGALALAERVEAVFAKEQVEQWARCFVVLTDRKIRIRRS